MAHFGEVLALTVTHAGYTLRRFTRCIVVHATRCTQTMLEALGPLLEAETAKHCRRQLPLETRVIGDAPNLYG